MAVVAGGISVGVGYLAQDRSSSQSGTRAPAIPNTKTKNQGTLIYRGGSGTAGNLTPKPKDANGLSFYRMPPAPPNKYVVTSIEAVNSTGLLNATIDGANHVSVRPTIPGTMDSWIESRGSGHIHPYTAALQSVDWDPFNRGTN